MGKIARGLEIMRRIIGLLFLIFICCLFEVSSIEAARTSTLYNQCVAMMKNESNDKETIECFRQVIKSDPTSTRARYNLGVLYMRGGDSDRALASFIDVVRNTPDEGLSERALHNISVLLIEVENH